MVKEHVLKNIQTKLQAFFKQILKRADTLTKANPANEEKSNT